MIARNNDEEKGQKNADALYKVNKTCSNSDRDSVPVRVFRVSRMSMQQTSAFSFLFFLRKPQPIRSRNLHRGSRTNAGKTRQNRARDFPSRWISREICISLETEFSQISLSLRGRSSFLPKRKFMVIYNHFQVYA